MSVFHCLDSIMSLVSKTQNLKPRKLAALAVQAGLCLTWLETPKTVFCLCEKHLSSVMRKPTFWFLTWSDTNQAVQLQKMARGLKFRI